METLLAQWVLWGHRGIGTETIMRMTTPNNAIKIKYCESRILFSCFLNFRSACSFLRFILSPCRCQHVRHSPNT